MEPFVWRPEDDAWYAGYFDDTHWEPDDAEWAEWDDENDKWVPTVTNNYEVDLAVNASATWEEGYEPTNIKFIIENDPGDLYINLYGTDTTIASNAPVTSNSGIDFGDVMIWDAPGDIDYFYLYSDGSNSGWAITGIEFYKDTVSSYPNTETLDYVNVFGSTTEIVFLGDSDLGYNTASSTFLNQGAGVYFEELQVGVPTNATNRHWLLTGIDIWNATSSGWDDRSSNTYWTGQDNASWSSSNNAWITSVTNTEMQLTVSGTWNESYAVGTAKIRLTWMPTGGIISGKM
jgi:hypothetical protein